MQDKRLKIKLIIIKRSISEILNDHFKSFLSKPVNIRTWTLMTENACKSLCFNTMPVITTRIGRKRGTLECGLHEVACVANVIGEGEGRAPNSLIFFLLPSLPLPFPDVFYESLFFRNKMASPVKRSRMVALSAERVLQSLEKKGDGNDGMSSGEESDLYRHLQETGDIYRSRYKVSCVTVLLRKLAHNAFHFQIIFFSFFLAIQSTTMI